MHRLKASFQKYTSKYLCVLENFHFQDYFHSLKNNCNRKQTCGCQGGERGREGLNCEFGISRCKLLYIEWINNKVPQYSTGNYMLYPVINHNGKEYEK